MTLQFAISKLKIDAEYALLYLKSRPELGDTSNLSLTSNISFIQYSELKSSIPRHKRHHKSSSKINSKNKMTNILPLITKKKERKSKRSTPKNTEMKLHLRAFKLSSDRITLHHQGVTYTYKLPKDYVAKRLDLVLKAIQQRLSKKRWNSILNNQFEVEIFENCRFQFRENIELYILRLQESFLGDNFIINDVVKRPIDKNDTNTIHETILRTNNVDFFDGYYEIKLGEDIPHNAFVQPLRIMDEYSTLSLRYVEEFFKKRFPQNIKIVYDDKSIISITEPLALHNYIRLIQEQLVENKSLSLNNSSKVLTLDKAKKFTEDEISQILFAYKNIYIDNLVNLQGSKKLIPARENFHGTFEDAFIFSVPVNDASYALVFENVSTARATEIFIINENDYEASLNEIFHYFANQSHFNKRKDLRNRHDLSHIRDYHYIIHDDLQKWLFNLNKLIHRNDKKSHISFVPGLRVPKDNYKRAGHPDTIRTKNIHNELIVKLFDILSSQYGAQNVGTEIEIENKRIDLVVRTKSFIDIYEIKTHKDPLRCLREAIGQLCEYAFLCCEDTIRRMVVVGPEVATSKVNDYINWCSNQYNLAISYLTVSSTYDN